MNITEAQITNESRSSNEAQHLYAEQIKLLYTQSGMSMIASWVNSMILTFILWSLISHTVLMIWVTCIFLITFIRYVSVRRYKQTSVGYLETALWAKRFTVGIVSSGICWGSAGVFLFPMDSIGHQVFIAFVLGGMVAGAVGSYSVTMRDYIGYSLPALIPVIIRLFMQGTEIHIAMGFMVLLFTLIMLATALRMNTTILSSLKLQLEKRGLITYLTSEKERAENLNEELNSEIIERKHIEEKLRESQAELERRVEERTADIMIANEKLKREIEERKRTESALQESEEKHRTIIESIEEGYYEIDLAGKFTFFNDALCKIIRYARDELIGMHYKEYTDEKQAKKLLETFKKISTTGKPGALFDYNVIRKDGTIGIHETLVSLIKDSKGQPIGFRGISRDVTKRRHLEAQLKKAQKMEAIGTLAGGVAHDLNNILSGIVSYPELLLMDLPEDSPLRKPLSTIQKSGEKAAAIVQDLLTLARRGVAVTEVVNLNTIISDYFKSPEFERLQSFYPTVTVKTDLETNLCNIFGSPVHLSKSFMNLVSNAAEAMGDGGIIFISTENRYIDTLIRGYDNVKEGDYIILTVSDTGVGILTEDMEKIFEPFYTKKKMGRSGTGLGMSVVWGTVKDHKGYIDVQSMEGKGTTFTLYFPISRKEIAKDKSLASIEDFMGKGETLLVVDDVEEQREIASQMLKKLGYSVTSVASGEEAIEYMKKNSADLLILDMIMDPGIDGLETYKRLLKLHPNQKAILASGFSETKRVKEAQKLGAGEYVKKPYILEKIGPAIKKELDR